MPDFSPDDLYGEAVQSALYIDDSTEIANALLKLIRSLSETGRIDYARALLPKTLLRIRELSDDRERAYLLRLFIERQCALDRLDEARETLALLDFDADQRAGALRTLSLALVRAERPGDALLLAEEIEDLDDYEALLEAAGQLRARQGFFGEAMSGAVKIEDIEPRCRLLGGIALAQWNASQAEETLRSLRSAVGLARTVEDEDVRDRILANLAVAFLDIHRVFDALSLAREVTAPSPRIETLCRIAVSLQESGNFTGAKSAIEEALAAARRLVDPALRGSALRQAAAALQVISDTEDARDVFREALGATGEIRNDDAQARTLVGFGRQLAELGLQTFAKRILRIAVERAESIEDGSFRVLVLRDIIRAQVDAALTEEARETVRRVEELRDAADSESAWESVCRELPVLYGLVGAGHLSESDDFERGVAEARKLRDPLDRTTALRELAEILALSKDANGSS